jgi:hypothetical protein
MSPKFLANPLSGLNRPFGLGMSARRSAHTRSRKIAVDVLALETRCLLSLTPKAIPI